MPIWSTTGDAFVGRRHTIRRHLVCAMQGHFPVLARGAAGELAVVFRTGAPHYGLPGTLATACSTDGGQSWSDPVEVAARWSDVRNPALGTDATGAWVLAYWQAGTHAYGPVPDGDAAGERRWQGPGRGGHDDEPATFVVRSEDRGRTWSAPQPVASKLLAWCSPFGRITAAPDGTLVLPAYGAPRSPAESRRYDAIVLRSRDGGLTWGDESRVAADTSELSLCWLGGDVVLGAVRHAQGHCVLVRSLDAGHTWGPPVALTRAAEHPADLCLLASGRLLLTFGRRRRPLGCGALVSDDGGLTWDHGREVLLAGDGIGNDVGYPSTVQVADGTIVTTLYFARGSAASDAAEGWGEVSCQALRYGEDLFAP